MTEQNAIAQRLATIQEQWLRFRDDPAARLLIWRATPDEASLIDTFVARECEQELARTPDLFVQLSAPFHSARTHGFALAQALCTHHEQALASLAAADRALHWRCPRIDERASDLSVLGSVLDSLRRSLVADDSGARLVVWLDPSDVHSEEAYLRWLARLVRQTPRELCFLVVDDSAGSTFAPLAQAEPAGVAAQTCALDLPAAFASLAGSTGAGSTGAGSAGDGSTGDGSAGAGSMGAGSAGDQLRLLQTQLAIAVGAGALTRAEQLATSATGLATAQGWPHLAATVQMTLAAGYGRALRYVDAHGAYSRAEQLAHEAAQDTAHQDTAHQDTAHQDTAHQVTATCEDDTPTHARQLCLHARLGRAAVLLTLRSYQQAAATYLDAAALAHALADARLELDGHRLASVCLTLQREPARAWQVGLRGLQLALGMDAETRTTSSLLYLAEHLVRITETESAYSAHQRPLAEQLARLLGADWRTQLAGSPAHLGGVPQTKTSSL